MELRVYSKNSDEIKTGISKIIEAYNEASEANRRKDGVVHNYSFIEHEDFLCMRIDTGSAGIEIIRKLIKGLSKYSGVQKVEVDI
ncbi:MAG TPA: hypothetical protein VFM99_06630 [Chitinophagales bacterium]|nr:hypothetical protein [Chitinophagales bacterium]